MGCEPSRIGRVEPRPQPPDLVIFDCDGVLVDSEPLSLACLARGLGRIGLPIDVDSVRRRFAGRSMTSIMDEVAHVDGVRAPPGFLEALRVETLAIFDAELAAMAGAAAVIQGLGLPVCVASSSDPVRLRHSLTLTGLLPLFSGNVFSSAQVARGKPFPDLFLFAAERMGVPPGACVVVEDSVPGVSAACAAGMRVLGFTGGGHWRHDATGADLARAGASRVVTGFAGLGAALSAL